MYKFLKADKGYINNAVERNDTIQWDCNDNTISFYIIVKAPFGVIIDFEDEAIQKKFIDQHQMLGDRENIIFLMSETFSSLTEQKVLALLRNLLHTPFLRAVIQATVTD